MNFPEKWKIYELICYWYIYKFIASNHKRFDIVSFYIAILTQYLLINLLQDFRNWFSASMMYGLHIMPDSTSKKFKGAKKN